MSLRFRARNLIVASVLALVTIEAPAQADDPSPAVACADAAQRGQVLRDNGKLIDARATLRACLNVECPSAIRRDCDSYLRDIEVREPSLVVRVRNGADEDILPTRIRIDEFVLPQSQWARAFEVDPGVHVIAVEAPGRDAVRQSIMAREGERARAVSVMMGPDHRAALHVASTRTPWLLGIASAGTLGLGSFGYFAITGVRSWNTANDECRPNCTSSEVRDVHTRLLAADISLAISAVAFAVVTYLFVTDPARHASVPQ